MGEPSEPQPVLSLRGVSVVVEAYRRSPRDWHRSPSGFIDGGVLSHNSRRCIVIEIVVAAVAVVVCAALVFGMAVWMLAQAERYDVSERADARRSDDLAGLNVFDGGWDD